MARFERRRTDRLSALQDELLCHIISFLPIQETVRTSILSTRWKNLFTLITTLNLDYNNMPKESARNNFTSYVDRFLFARKGLDVHMFRLKFRRTVHAFRAEGWIQYALSHNVRDLEVDLGVPVELPARLFTCKNLVTLKLQMVNGFVLKIPRKVILPKLKILHLELIKFSDDNSVERIFSNCSALEELVVQSCNFENVTKFNVWHSTLKRLTICQSPGVYEHKEEVMINAPNLVYFKYFHFIAKKHSVIDLHGLVEAHIDFGPVLKDTFYDSATTDLIRGISNVQSLHLSGLFSEALLLGHGQIPMLKNMTYLKIGQPYPQGWQRLLDFAPCLETLVFEELPRSLKFHDSTQCSSSQIKAIKFLSFRGMKSEFRLVKYLLKNMQAVEKVIIHMSTRKNLNIRRLKVSEELLKYPRASKNCQVVII